MRVFLGVDGGNTKTLAVLADETGQVLGTGRAGNGDIYGAASPEAAMEAVRAAVGQAVTAAGSPPIDYGAFSIAGADWPEDYAYIGMQLSPLCTQIRIENDSYGALRAGTKDAIGVAVICGTYGTVGAGGPTGKRWQGGFWHRAESGAVPLGQAVFSHVLDAELGIKPPTSLTASLLAFYGQPSVPEMLHHFTRREGGGKSRDGALAGMLFEAAVAGDEGALEIVQHHGVRQGAYAVAAARHVGLEGAFPLVLAGGVLRYTPNPLEAVIVSTVQETFPLAIPTRLRFEPMIGALLLAYDAAGIPVDGELEDRLKESGPGSEFYDSRA